MKEAMRFHEAHMQFETYRKMGDDASRARDSTIAQATAWKQKGEVAGSIAEREHKSARAARACGART